MLLTLTFERIRPQLIVQVVEGTRLSVDADDENVVFMKIPFLFDFTGTSKLTRARLTDDPHFTDVKKGLGLKLQALARLEAQNPESLERTMALTQ